MKNSLKPSLEHLSEALGRLETTLDKKLKTIGREKVEPQLDLASRNERDVNKKIAAKLDQTINRLEMLLSEG